MSLSEISCRQFQFAPARGVEHQPRQVEGPFFFRAGHFVDAEALSAPITELTK
jgi:hypothetical protein